MTKPLNRFCMKMYDVFFCGLNDVIVQRSQIYSTFEFINEGNEPS